MSQSPSDISDLYQTRYEAHQLKKKDQLAYSKGESYESLPTELLESFESIIKARRTQRVFNSSTIESSLVERMMHHVSLCPSSCNRQAISIKVIGDRHKKELLSGLLVGGVGWCHRANVILLIFADQQAYKAPGEINFMPYLDAGVIIHQLYLSGAALNIGTGYVNPNIREENKKYFNENFNQNEYIYCGAMALGNYDAKAENTPKRKASEVWS